MLWLLFISISMVATNHVHLFLKQGPRNASYVESYMDTSFEGACLRFTQKIVPSSLRGLQYLVDVVTVF